MLKILIVEDNEIQRKLLIEMVQNINSNLDIMSTDSVKEAIMISDIYDIEAFFIDILLIDGSGIELAKRLRKAKKYQFTPIVFVTALRSKEIETYREIHSYDYIVKPFTEDVLKKTMDNILTDYLEIRSEQKKNKYIYLQMNSINQRINFENILYIEYLFRKIMITTMHEKIKYKHVPLKKFAEKLSDDFVQIHQSIVVNKVHINKINLKERYCNW
jgi:two-component system LytT family response regulator